MKKYLLLLLLSFSMLAFGQRRGTCIAVAEIATPPTFTPTYVSTTRAEGTTATISVTGLTPTSGNLLIATWGGNVCNITVPTGFTQLGVSTANFSTFGVYYKISDGTETSVSFTTDAVSTINNNLAHVIEYSGVNITTPIEQFNTVQAINASSISTTSMTSTGTNRLAVALSMNCAIALPDGALVQALPNYTLNNEDSDTSRNDSWRLTYSSEVLTASTKASETIIFPISADLGMFNLMIIPQ